MSSPLCILNFHGIGTPHANVAEDEARYWVSRDQFLAMLDRIKLLSSRGTQIKITFDDGNLSDLEIACPALQDRNLVGHFFVLTGRLDDPAYLSAGQVRDLLAKGMEIGLHGQDHVDWRKADAPQLQTETITARDTLSRITGRPVETVAIPFGAYNARVIKHLKASGFKEIYTSDGGHAAQNQPLRHRTSVRSDMDVSRIDAIVADSAPARAKIKRTVKSWLKSNVI
ncbi:polysaccharide deacetylase family protein [Flavimaricola marinus]|uniref:Chitooligosaccharide deacetylase n=1 Tax=Flavimaricola marinus TaxID=1819565 RepID=A0A238LK07_9RHOB|nr:polysaccharide deacetylase family protein [Flavimaricola marinus]SMY09296.1 Polysaccharide deacetylase [Flavimaricola marinus]